MSKEAVIKVAMSERGYSENPAGSNRTKYWEVFDKSFQGQPWCVAFLWWVFWKAGESAAFFGGAKTASCGTLLKWYEAQGQTVKKSEVQPGDIVILNFSGTKDTQHCGIVTDKINDSGWWHTVEGNTTPGLEGSQDNGGNVAYKARHISQMVGICRPKYKVETVAVPKTDYETHWAKEHIEWGKRTEIVSGYEDGTFRPNNNVTRAELLAILHRYDTYRFGGSENK